MYEAGDGGPDETGSSWGASQAGRWVVALRAVHGDCAHPFLQNRLLCVQTVAVTTWFSWLCLRESSTGSRDRRSSCQLPHRPPALSMILRATVTTATGPTVPHLRHWSPLTATGGASVPVSIGETRRGWCLGEGRGTNGAGEVDLWQPGQADGPFACP